MTSIIPTTIAMGGGVDAGAGVGGTATITVANTWATGDTFLINLTNSTTGVSLTLGYGTISNSSPTFVMTYRNKVNLLLGTTWAFSEVGGPTSFNTVDGVGNGFIGLSDAYSESDTSQAIAPFQGKLAVFGQNSVQIWQVDADPLNYQLAQVLENIGTVAKDSVKSIGELDTFFLHGTGLRSLQARAETSNAFMSDIGSPIDLLVKDKLGDSSATQVAAACGVVEPNDSQYWCFILDTIYVLSYFPRAKITAWSTFNPTYQANANTAITFENNYTLPVIVRFGYTSTASQYFASYTVTNGTTQTNIEPANYMWVYDSTGTNLLVTYTIPTGMLFQGVITLSSLLAVSVTANQTAFTPQKFVVSDRRVVARTSDAFLVYGGANRETYDNTICAFETSWLDADTPANLKKQRGADVAQEGSWSHYVSNDYLGGNLQVLLSAQTAASFDGGKIPYTTEATHLKWRGQTTGTAAKAMVSNLLFHYTPTPQK